MSLPTPLLVRTRRHFFGQCALGLGSLGLASLLSDGRLFAAVQPAPGEIPLQHQPGGLVELTLHDGACEMHDRDLHAAPLETEGRLEAE